METFHYALRPGGFLVLGSSEFVDGASDLYATVSRENHIYRAREVAIRKYPVPETVPHYKPRQPAFSKFKEAESQQRNRISFGELHQKLLEHYAPPSLVVNEEYEIMHMSENAGSFLEFSSGEPTKNLLKLIRPELRLELRSALYQAVQHQTATEARNIQWHKNGNHQALNIHVKPITQNNDTAKGFILVIFELNEQEQNEEKVVVTSAEPIARQLEEELVTLKAQLRQSVKEHEYQAEELKASNEELQAMNEELRSAAEELETSKKELQSMNEELRTVNQELKVKIDEISVTSNNLQNLINSADVATIFLDRAFCIRLYTPVARQIFNLIPSDYGRPISDITHRLESNNLLPDAETVLEKLTIVEREVKTTDNRFFMMKVLPYRTTEDRISGVVVTFFDITERKQAEESLRASEEKYRVQLEKQVKERTAELKQSRDRYSTLIENTPDVITRWDKDLKLVFANSAFASKTGINNESLLGKTIREMGQPDEIALPYLDSLRKAFETGETIEHFNSFPSSDEEAYFYYRITPERNATGEVEIVLAIARDITKLRKAEQEITLSKQFLQSVMDSSLDVIQVFDAIRNETGKIIDFTWKVCNRRGMEQLGDVVGKSLRQQNPGVVASGVFDQMVQVVESGLPFEQEQYYAYEQFPDNWFYLTLVKHNDGVILTTKDITFYKKAESERLKSLMLLQQSEEVAQIGSWEYDIATGSFSWSEGMYHLFGLPVGSPVRPETYLEFVVEEDKPLAQQLVKCLRESFKPLEETLRLRVNGQVLTIRIKAVVLRNEQGEPIKMLGIDLDILEVKRLEEENLQMRLDQQKALLLGILDAQEEERSRISESLHNGVGQLLYATKLNLDQVTPHAPTEIMKNTKQLLDDAIQEIRRVSHELVPIILKDFGLARAVQDLCEKYSQSSIQVNCEVEGLENRLESYLELAIYRICQELLTNVTKHAEATTADILLEQEDGELTLKVRDNGKGMNQEPGKKPGIGLRTIRDRVKLLNGTFSITTPISGKGTQVTIRIPVASMN